jgi:hypothetical protein
LIGEVHKGGKQILFAWGLTGFGEERDARLGEHLRERLANLPLHLVAVALDDHGDVDPARRERKEGSCVRRVKKNLFLYVSSLGTGN